MRTVRVVLIVASLACSSCVFRSSRHDAAASLASLASETKKATFAAVYRFGYTRQVAPGITTRMEIAHTPMASLRRLDTETKSRDGKTVTVTSWQAHNAQGDFVCTQYPGAGIQCQTDPVASGTFGTSSIDDFFDTPQQPDAFASVRKATRTVRVSGEDATCFEAVPVAPSQVPVSPEPTPQSFRFELCYAADGVLLSGRRTTLDSSDTAQLGEAFVEAVSVSRVVAPRDLRLPGPVVQPSDLKQ